jgi:hypothetical protein
VLLQQNAIQAHILTGILVDAYVMSIQLLAMILLLNIGIMITVLVSAHQNTMNLKGMLRMQIIFLCR